MNFFFFILQVFINIFIIFHFKKISKIVNLFDLPDDVRKLHKKKVAAIGGCLIFFNLSIFFFINSIQYVFFSSSLDNFTLNELIVFYLFAFLFFIIGFFDDKFHFSSNIKLLLFVIIILVFIWFNNIFQIQNIKFSFLVESIDISYISFIFTILAFLLFINAFNMFDGINLQSGFYTIFIFSIFLYKGIFIELSFLLIISLIFFLYLNFKNKCFLGNNGTLFISFIICYFFIKSSVSYKSFYADEIFLIMMIPGIDLLRLAIFRIWSGKHPFKPDRNHIHHILVNNLGFLKATIILNFLTIIPYIIAVLFGYIAHIIIFILQLYFLLILKYSYIKKY